MKKILCIEDHEDTAEAVKRLLVNAGYETEIALTGKEGIRKAKEGFDLVILDIMLPDMSGWDIFKTLTKGKADKCKYMFLSVIPISSERMKELKKAGISDYVTKPFNPKELIERVSRIVK